MRLFVLCLLPAVAWAAPDLGDAKRAFRDGEHAQALEHYRALDRPGTPKRAAVRWGIGRSLEMLDRPLDARDAFVRCLEITRDRRRRRQIELKIATLEQTRLGRLELRCGRERVEAAGRPLRCGETVWLPAGRWTIEGRLGEWPLEAAPVEVRAGRLTRHRLAAPARLSSVGAATIEVEGRPVRTPIALPAGTWQVRVDGALQRVTLMPGEVRLLEAEAPPSDTGPWVLAGAGGLLVLAGGIGLALAVDSAGERDEAYRRYRQTAGPPSRIGALRDQARDAADATTSRRRWGWLGVGLGVGLGGAAAIWGTRW